MTNCTSSSIDFPACRKRHVEADFSGGDISSNAGVLLLRQADRLSGLTASVARRLSDERQKGKVEHPFAALLRQRVYALALGYEDVNDHEGLRRDLALQTAVERDRPLASPSTLSRFENAADRAWAWSTNEALVENFIASHSQPPEELILDFDATDDAVHGRQVGRFFHGYYDHYCFLPLYGFCGDHLLFSYLRPSNKDGAKHAWAILSLLVKRLRQAWPEVRIIFRGDSGFCRHKMLGWCERHDVGYIVGLAKNARLNDLAAPWMAAAANDFEAGGVKQRRFGEFTYAATTWMIERRVIARIEHGRKGANPRYIVTNLEGEAQELYDKLYCQRGNMENRIKEQQLDLFADRTSCHGWWANQFRLLLSSIAYTLIETIRRCGLAGSDMARAQAGTIRLKLLKIGAVIVRNTRRLRFHLSSACPDKALFRLAAERLTPE
ncbi:MAG: IS1380 family transposase [Alphaproteobacteria bacterium]|nr:IS1380 family transposase [Alphaproteobacteria bacterium]MDP7428696.1 IS1380 family transposase [Alphaproteobacteria bacterium]